MKSNTILASLVISGIVATTATKLEWEPTYARYHRNLSKAGKGESSTGSSKSTKSPTAITSSGSKSSKGSGSKGSGSKSSKSSGQTLTLEPSSSPSINPISSGPTPAVTVDSIAPTFDPFPPDDEPCDFSCTGIGGGFEPFPNPDRLLCPPGLEEEGCPFGEQTCQDLQDDALLVPSDNALCVLATNVGVLDFCCDEISSPSPSPDPFTPTNDPFATPNPTDTLTPEPTDTLTPEPTDTLTTPSPTIDVLAPTSSPSTSPTIFSKSAKGAKSSGSKSSKSTTSSGSKSSKSTTSKSSKAAAAVAPQSAFTMFKNWWN